MAGKRKKRRTHVKADDAAFAKTPKSFVIKSGQVGASLQLLVKDMRRVMEPNTASNLKERKGNKLKDFVHIAGQLSVTHMMIFSKTDNSINLRIGRIPRGPTLCFKVKSYVLAKDLQALQKRPKSPGSDFKCSPLVVLNNFNSDLQQIKLMATMFQNIFPPINVQTMKLADARRVVLFHRDPETEEIELRHYSIGVKAVGISKSVKSLVQTNIPDLANFEDVSDFILRGAYASESDVEDGPESTVTLSQNYVGRGNKQSSQRAVRLIEMGPRLQLRLFKIYDGLCEGDVIFHDYVKKTEEEVKLAKQARDRRLSQKNQRKLEQEKNVEKKKEKKAQSGKRKREDTEGDDDDEGMDADDEDMSEGDYGDDDNEDLDGDEDEQDGEVEED
ncbi:hypothetical protein HDU76_006103 [Blyttiomyces sp. JEL0837]|nr:hypothetical protein HDU76_006103 [Blyttiomyces sp. JEL0837]